MKDVFEGLFVTKITKGLITLKKKRTVTLVSLLLVLTLVISLPALSMSRKKEQALKYYEAYFNPENPSDRLEGIVKDLLGLAKEAVEVQSDLEAWGYMVKSTYETFSILKGSERNWTLHEMNDFGNKFVEKIAQYREGEIPAFELNNYIEHVRSTAKTYSESEWDWDCFCTKEKYPLVKALDSLKKLVNS